MTEQTNLVPKRRFKEFQKTHTWEQRKLGSIAAFNPKAELPETFEYVDLESVVGIEIIAHREETRATAPSRAQRLAKQGDLFYQTVRPYQKNNYLFEKADNNYVFSTGYAQMRPFCNGYFLLSLVQTEPFVKSVLDRCTGTSYPAINSNDLADMKVVVPANGAEQNKIGSFFKQLDTTIALQHRKLEKTKALKSAYLSEMFPAEGEREPKRRFAGFTQAWEQCKLSEVAIYRNGKAHEKDISDSGSFVVVNSKFVSTNGQIKKFTYKQIEPLKKNEIAFVLSDVPNGRAIARTFLIPESNKYSLNQRIAGITPNDNTDPYFLKELMNRHHYFLRFDDGVGQTNLSKKEVEDFEELYPVFAEQQKIGHFFNQLENLIAIHQRKLEKLQDLKKAYLNEMFV